MIIRYNKKYNIHIALTITIFIIFFLVTNSNQLSNEISILQDVMNSQSVEINSLNDQIRFLNESLSKTNSSLEIVEKERNILEFDYSNLRDETLDLINDVDEYKKEISESLDWYKMNSILDDSSDQENIKMYIDNHCFDVDDECRIKLGCFWLINSEKLDLEYIYDYTPSGDKISSISEIIENGGGDCEDYSLLFKAEYNYALSQCDGNAIILEGWKYPEDGDNEIKYWATFRKSWYIDDVVRVDITENVFPNIVCGSLYDPNIEEISGHCMIAFTTQRIETISDLKYLNDAPLIEPQDGSYQGKINNENSEVYLLNEDTWYDNSVTSWIDSVITDTDYFLFSYDELDWNSYSLFESLLEKSEWKIISMLDE
ncbi:MAG: hypothetical protein JW789_01040 [Candidatus Aenigmarchaeota archaeon]|nr:hypothetical protein [Candidatus Aenigmarchaeota archaeon]